MRTCWKLGMDRRGGALALVAVTMVVLLGVAALAVDLASGFAARAEAQRVADASALAGGSAFLDIIDTVQAEPVARDRAYEYALKNTVRHEPIDSSMVQVQILRGERKVRVWITKTGLPTWFAKILGFNQLDVSAMAAAQASAAGAAKCLKPFAIPDLWDELAMPTGQDENDDDVWETDEEWAFEPNNGDRYQRFNPDSAAWATGYGSPLRNGRGPNPKDNDHGRQIQIKVSDPQSEYALSPGLFFPWRLPPDTNMEECEQGGGGQQDSGGATYRRNICKCNQNPISLGVPYDLEPGDMIGPTAQGIGELIDEDPDAYWDDQVDRIMGSDFADPMDSPRVIKIALFDISQVSGPGMQSITFNNFALLFLESQTTPRSPVVGRFLYFADGSDEGPVNGSLVYYLRLVE
jgi:hypothetical protein